MRTSYSEVTPYIKELAQCSCDNNTIAPAMYVEHHVNRGLRDMNGNGVVTGLTEVSRIKAKEIDEDGNVIPCHGELYYRGYNVRDLTSGKRAILPQQMQKILSRGIFRLGHMDKQALPLVIMLVGMVTVHR